MAKLNAIPALSLEVYQQRVKLNRPPFPTSLPTARITLKGEVEISDLWLVIIRIPPGCKLTPLNLLDPGEKVVEVLRPKRIHQKK
ncbi:hypothetical protein TCAL_14287 [Tigriopus californicus]|uniref:Uncharacterized protein n=1 Tax=Tigriopus californicus TaxID=6832 RepID=A0A553NC56_TIGCA|nr:hypothetical protein TCAL_14287 [Tigriopus californicus]